MRTILALALLVLLPACQSYVVPGSKADFGYLGLTPETKQALTDQSVRDALARKPLVTFPAAVAVGHLQGADYGSWGYCQGTYGVGNYSIVTVRQIERDEDFAKLAALPKLTGIVPLKRLVLPHDLKSDVELRAAAANLHADLLLLYTFDTAFQTDTHIAPLGVISLGLFPNRNAKVTTTASAILMDTRNGYIYAVIEATSKDHQLANAWTSDQAIDEVRQRAETEAFRKLVDEFVREWPNVLRTYDRPGAVAQK